MPPDFLISGRGREANCSIASRRHASARRSERAAVRSASRAATYPGAQRISACAHATINQHATSSGRRIHARPAYCPRCAGIGEIRLRSPSHLTRVATASHEVCRRVGPTARTPVLQ
jgi:hypothetical protein